MADLVEQMREMYEAMGSPRHPRKSVQRALHGEVQGAMLDGGEGLRHPKPEKAQVYCQLADELIRRGQCALQELQVVCDGFIYFVSSRIAVWIE